MVSVEAPGLPIHPVFRRQLQGAVAFAMLLLASLKVLLIPLGILAFLLVLLIIGAVGLGVAMGVISSLSWLWRLAFGRESRAKQHLNDPFT